MLYIDSLCVCVCVGLQVVLSVTWTLTCWSSACRPWVWPRRPLMRCVLSWAVLFFRCWRIKYVSRCLGVTRSAQVCRVGLSVLLGDTMHHGDIWCCYVTGDADGKEGPLSDSVRHGVQTCAQAGPWLCTSTPQSLLWGKPEGAQWFNRWVKLLLYGLLYWSRSGRNLLNLN